MKKYEIYNAVCEVSKEELPKVENYFAVMRGGTTNERKVVSFDTKEEAQEELKKYKCRFYRTNIAPVPLWILEDYYIYENEYKNGEIYGCVGVWEFAKFDDANNLDPEDYSKLNTEFQKVLKNEE